MLNANELRIGNLIYQPTTDENLSAKVMPVVARHFLTISDKPDWFKPILLTGEWLLKFGFRNRMQWYTIAHYPICINISITHNIATIGCDEEYCVEIQYVHQLQNLYFALTGKELEYA